MRRPLTLVIGVFLAVGLLAGCATASSTGSAGGPEEPHLQAGAGQPDDAPAESTAEPEGADPAAFAQAQAWLDATPLPPGAIRVEAGLGGFSSYTGWPCGPVEEITAFWTVTGMTVSEVVRWFAENPPADLVSTLSGPVADDPTIDSGIVGYTPADRSLQGVVYTMAEAGAGVSVRAEIAAFTAAAECPPPPGGGEWGLPGQG